MKTGEFYFVHERPARSWKSSVSGTVAAAVFLCAIYYCWSVFQFCAAQVEQQLGRDYVVANSLSCNEHFSFYQEYLDCKTPRENLDPRAQSARIAMCWIGHINIFQSWKTLLGLILGLSAYVCYSLIQLLRRPSAPTFMPIYPALK